MKQSYAQIRAQIEKLERQAEELRRAEIAGVIERIKVAIVAYGLTAEDLGLSVAPQSGHTKTRTSKNDPSNSKAASPSSPKVPVKFRDKDGHTWSGRGSQPRWLRDALNAGQRLEDFRV